MPNAPIRDTDTYYEEAGSGPPVLLINGLAGDLQSFVFQVRALSPHSRVIAFDNRGAGRSASPDRPYTIPQMAEDAAALLAHLGVEKASVVGYSMGGAIAQELVLAHPDLVDKLVLVSSTASIEGYVHTLLTAWIAVRRSNMSRDQIARLTATWLYSPELLDDAERLERSISASIANPYPQQDHAFLRQAAALLQHDAADRLSAVKAPTLVLHGEDDTLIPARNGEKLASLIPGATFKTLKGGHAGMFEFRDEYNEELLAFLGAAVPA